MSASWWLRSMQGKTKVVPWKRRMPGRPPSCRPQLEGLEDRLAPATFVVNDPDTGDVYHDFLAPSISGKGPAKTENGAITFTSAMMQNHLDGGGDVIDFSGPMTIVFASLNTSEVALFYGPTWIATQVSPGWSDFAATQVTIQGVSQDDGPAVVFTGRPWANDELFAGPGSVVSDISLVGMSLWAGAGSMVSHVCVDGEGQTSGSISNGIELGEDCTLEDSVVSGFQTNVEAASGTTIRDNFIGTTPDGTAAAPANLGYGVIAGDCKLFQDNVVAGNPNGGVFLSGNGTQVVGNKIGTDKSGMHVLGNGGVGLSVTGQDVVIDSNVIAGNGGGGLFLSGDGGWVQNNEIGTDAAGATALGNGGEGIEIFLGTNFHIGGPGGQGNVIAANIGDGIVVGGKGGNTIQGNYIGTNASGASSLGNTQDGVYILDGSDNTVGGDAAGDGNVIGGNQGDGVRIEGYVTAATGNQVAGNFIGTSADGSAELGNQGNGIAIIDASDNTIGGETDAAGNVICGNGKSGQGKNDGGGPGDVGVAGAAGLPDGTAGNPPAGAASADSTGTGIFVEGMASNNPVQGNYIGITKGNKPDGNHGDGVLIRGASNNVVGGTDPNDRNIISANGGAGVRIVSGADGTPAAGNMVQGNYIGADSSGKPSESATTGSNPLGNTDGVVIGFDSKGQTAAALNNTIGALTSGPPIGGDITNDPASNVIAGNNHDGVVIGAGTGNRISRNTIYMNGHMGINLGTDGGITAPISPTGAAQNTWQNYPIIYAIDQGPDAFSASGSWSLSFFVPGDSATTYKVEFYANGNRDGSGLSEGEEFLGSADAQGNTRYTLPFTPTAKGTAYITGIALDPSGNTSEFSPCRDVLRNSVGSSDDPKVLAPPSGTEIYEYFTPTLNPAVGVNNLSDVARICDVAHFNWVQYVTHEPTGFTPYKYQGNFFLPSPAGVAPVQWKVDPDPPVAPYHYLLQSDAAISNSNPNGYVSIGIDTVQLNPKTGQPYPIDANGNPPVQFDQYPYYLNEVDPDPNPSANQQSYDISNSTTESQLQFYDSPGIPQKGLIRGNIGNYETFETYLAGVGSDDAKTPVIWSGLHTSFTWRTNENSTPTGEKITDWHYLDAPQPGVGSPPNGTTASNAQTSNPMGGASGGSPAGPPLGGAVPQSAAATGNSTEGSSTSPTGGSPVSPLLAGPLSQPAAASSLPHTTPRSDFTILIAALPQQSPLVVAVTDLTPAPASPRSPGSVVPPSSGTTAAGRSNLDGGGGGVSGDNDISDDDGDWWDSLLTGLTASDFQLLAPTDPIGEVRDNVVSVGIDARGRIDADPTSEEVAVCDLVFASADGF